MWPRRIAEKRSGQPCGMKGHFSWSVVPAIWRPVPQLLSVTRTEAPMFSARRVDLDGDGGASPPPLSPPLPRRGRGRSRRRFTVNAAPRRRPCHLVPRLRGARGARRTGARRRCRRRVTKAPPPGGTDAGPEASPASTVVRGASRPRAARYCRSRSANAREYTPKTTLSSRSSSEPPPQTARAARRAPRPATHAGRAHPPPGLEPRGQPGSRGRAGSLSRPGSSPPAPPPRGGFSRRAACEVVLSQREAREGRHRAGSLRVPGRRRRFRLGRSRGGPGGPQRRRCRAQKAGTRGAATRGAADGGVVRNTEFEPEFGDSMLEQTTGALRGGRLPAPSPMAPGLPATPAARAAAPAAADPRGLTAVRANPLAGTAPSASGYGRSPRRLSPPHSGYAQSRVRGGEGVSRGASFAPSRPGRARPVWDRNRDPGEPGVAAPARAARRAPRPTHVATGRARPPRPGGGSGPTRVPDPARRRRRPVRCHILRRRGRACSASAPSVPNTFCLDGPGTPSLAHGRRDVLLSARRRKSTRLLELRHLAGRGDLNPTLRRVFGKPGRPAARSSPCSTSAGPARSS